MRRVWGCCFVTRGVATRAWSPLRDFPDAKKLAGVSGRIRKSLYQSRRVKRGRLKISCANRSLWASGEWGESRFRPANGGINSAMKQGGVSVWVRCDGPAALASSPGPRIGAVSPYYPHGVTRYPRCESEEPPQSGRETNFQSKSSSPKTTEHPCKPKSVAASLGCWACSAA